MGFIYDRMKKEYLLDNVRRGANECRSFAKFKSFLRDKQGIGITRDLNDDLFYFRGQVGWNYKLKPYNPDRDFGMSATDIKAKHRIPVTEDDLLARGWVVDIPLQAQQVADAVSDALTCSQDATDFKADLDAHGVAVTVGDDGDLLYYLFQRSPFDSSPYPYDPSRDFAVSARALVEEHQLMATEDDLMARGIFAIDIVLGGNDYDYDDYNYGSSVDDYDPSAIQSDDPFGQQYYKSLNEVQTTSFQPIPFQPPPPPPHDPELDYLNKIKPSMSLKEMAAVARASMTPEKQAEVMERFLVNHPEYREVYEEALAREAAERDQADSEPSPSDSPVLEPSESVSPPSEPVQDMPPSPDPIPDDPSTPAVARSITEEINDLRRTAAEMRALADHFTAVVDSLSPSVPSEEAAPLLATTNRASAQKER